jgi:hypothetical protein
MIVICLKHGFHLVAFFLFEIPLAHTSTCPYIMPFPLDTYTVSFDAYWSSLYLKETITRPPRYLLSPLLIPNMDLKVHIIQSHLILCNIFQLQISLHLGLCS